DSNYLVVLFQPSDANPFSKQSLTAIQALADAMWQLPYVVRVDSLVNQPRLTVTGDELHVAPLIDVTGHRVNSDNGNSGQVDAGEQAIAALNQAQLREMTEYAYGDELISKTYLSQQHKTTTLIASVSLPDEHFLPVLDLVEKAKALKESIQHQYPGSKVYLNGDVVIEGALLQVTIDDILRVNPVVFLTIFLLTGLLLRSLMAIAATIAVVVASTGISTGLNVFLGFEMNPITMMAPAIIMVLAVADSIHVLTVYTLYVRQGDAPELAMSKSLKKNLAPVFWTSVTTAVGFLGMNFGDSPPFMAMGNMAAIGILFAFLATFTVLPMIALMFPGKSTKEPFSLAEKMRWLSRWMQAMRSGILVMVFVSVGVLACWIPSMEVNDDISEYFDPSLDVYDSISFARKHANGVQNIYFSLNSGEPGGISDPEFLSGVERFSQWLRLQPEVSGVFSYVDQIKKIHQVMNANADVFYRIPNDRELIAQYQLLYEMSLPAGMNLNRDVNYQRSSLKLTVSVKDSDNQTLLVLEDRINQWLKQNEPQLAELGTSQLLMFAHMGTKIIRSMVDGSLFTLFFISLCMVIALRSLRFGLLSLIPNLFPPIFVYGIWAITVGQVNHAAAMTFSICLGLVVDDTIHFISKYLSERRGGNTQQQALEATFMTSGTAIVITSVTLICGVLLLSLSNFTVNDTMSVMLASIIATALIFDLFFLPSLLLWLDRHSDSKSDANSKLEPHRKIEQSTIITNIQH
ncbi:MAG: MMPL family transporter, partial [Pseudomonadales bacterium]|nr:MMPL family transporter [Pseudomonadales bacterium]